MSITCHNIFKCFAADFTLQMQAQSPESFRIWLRSVFSVGDSSEMADTDMDDSVDCACQTKNQPKSQIFATNLISMWFGLGGLLHSKDLALIRHF